MIQYSDVKAQVKAIGFETLRNETDTYFEVVFMKAKLNEYNAALNNLFGKISWPSDTPIPEEVKKVIAQYGSVMAGQTLYSFQEESHVIFAMLWPWGDGQHITLKTGEKK